MLKNFHLAGKIENAVPKILLSFGGIAVDEPIERLL
jgi:hypothetical protein